MAQLHILPVIFNHGGQQQVIYPVMLKDAAEVILVDCGYPGFIKLLESAAANHGILLQSLTGLIITHHDIDHMGSAAALKQLIPHLKIYASATDKPYVEGSKKSLRLEQAEAMLTTLTEEQRAWALGFIETLQAMQPVAVDATLSGGQILPVCEGLEVIDTPGHMPGHISLYLPRQKTLIAADALVYENGALNIANPGYTLDMKAAINSVKKLLAYDIRKMICYHGGAVEQNIKEDMQQLIERYS